MRKLVSKIACKLALYQMERRAAFTQMLLCRINVVVHDMGHGLRARCQSLFTMRSGILTGHGILDCDR